MEVLNCGGFTVFLVRYPASAHIIQVDCAIHSHFSIFLRFTRHPFLLCGHGDARHYEKLTLYSSMHD